jgi:hypothetical protein
MKPKTKAFLDEIAINPKQSNVDAYLKTHKTINRKSAGASAAKLLAKPSSTIYLEQHINKARNRIIDLVDSASKEEIQLRASQDILDRSYGKATQRNEITKSGITLNIDLTTSLQN